MKNPNDIKCAIDTLMESYTEGTINLDETLVLFERILHTISDVFGEDNVLVQHLKQEFFLAITRIRKHNTIKEHLHTLRKEEIALEKSLGLS